MTFRINYIVLVFIHPMMLGPWIFYKSIFNKSFFLEYGMIYICNIKI